MIIQMFLRLFHIKSFFITHQTSSKIKILSNLWNCQKFVLILENRSWTIQISTVFLKYRYLPIKISSFYVLYVCYWLLNNRSWESRTVTRKDQFFKREICFCFRNIGRKHGRTEIIIFGPIFEFLFWSCLMEFMKNI